MVFPVLRSLRWLPVAVGVVCVFVSAPAVAQPAPIEVSARANNPDLPAPASLLVQPEFPGGDGALIAFLGQTLRYPADAYQDGAEGRVDVSFWIDERGHPYGFGTVDSPHPSLAAEALRAVRLMPLWTPGQRDGRPVPLLVHVPVVFRRPTAK